MMVDEEFCRLEWILRVTGILRHVRVCRCSIVKLILHTF